MHHQVAPKNRRVAASRLGRLLCAITLTAAVVAGAAPRSTAVRAEFQRQQPCPATGAKRDACPGWQVDHVVPLKCNGADAITNMQWLTVEEHKQKTKREARLCRHGERE